MTVRIPIFLSSDNNYAPFVATTIASICDNTESFCDFYILDGGINAENRAKIQGLTEQYRNFSIEYINIDDEKYFKGFIANSYVTLPAYYRFIIPQLKQNLKKILYLDVDIIAKNDILELFNIDLGDKVIGAVKDLGDSYYITNLKNNVEINPSHTYFNSGVLLIDCEKWRRQNITEKLFDIEKKYRGKLLCNDQDVLNKVFENNYKMLPEKFNALTITGETVIRHYYTTPKPWEIEQNIKNSDLLINDIESFWQYAKKTPFYEQLLSNCKYKSSAQIQLLMLYKKITPQKVKVSIIIPVYNTENYLRKCLDSVCNQTLKDIEIICINDCSPDNSLEILKEYQKNDNRIKIIDFKENRGVSIARNTGIDVATGEYIGFIDSDDWIDFDYYEKLYNKAKEHYSDLVIGNVVEENELGVKSSLLSDLVLSKVSENKLNFNLLFVLGLYKKSLLLDNNIIFIENCIYGEDRLLPLMASFYAKNFQIDTTTYYHYLRNSISITKKSKNEKIMDSFILYNEQIFDFLAYQNISKEDYLTVVSHFWDEMLAFVLNLKEALRSRYLHEFYSCIIPKIRNDILCTLPLSKDLLSFLSQGDYKSCFSKIKAYCYNQRLSMLRKRVVENG